MMSHAYQREFDLVLFWSLDRFSREGAFETLQYLKKLDSFGIAFKSFTEQIPPVMPIFVGSNDPRRIVRFIFRKQSHLCYRIFWFVLSYPAVQPGVPQSTR